MKIQTSASITLATIAFSILLTGGLLPVRGQFDNLVCIAESSSSNCPATPASLTASVGGQLTLAVNVQNTEAINGFDIITITDPTVLQPVSNDLTGFLFEGQPNIVVVNNANATAGTSRVAAVIFGAFTTPPTTGRLFATTYNVVGPGAGIIIAFQQAILTNPDPVTVTLQTATFTSLEDFSISAAQTSLTVSRDSATATTITLSSLGGLAGDVVLMATVGPERKNGPTISLNPATVTLAPDGSASSTLAIETARNTFKGSYTVTVTGTAGSLSHSVTISLTVTR